jgi:hypothetical protein
VKVSLEVAAIQEKPMQKPKSFIDYFVNCLVGFNSVIDWFNPHSASRQKLHANTTYALGRVQTFPQGLWAGWIGFWYMCFRAITQIYVKPDQFARSHGAFGCLFGICISAFYGVWNAFMAIVTLLDRVMVGVSNGFFGTNELYIIDPTVRANIFPTASGASALLNYEKPNMQRQSQIKKALRLANNARRLWTECGPEFPKDHWHWKEVDIRRLKDKVIDHSKYRLGILDEEYDILINRLEECMLKRVSFSRFCLFLGDAVYQRLKSQPLDQFVSQYLAPSTPDAPMSMSGHAITPVGYLDDDEDVADAATALREGSIRNRRASFMMTKNQFPPTRRFGRSMSVPMDSISDRDYE